MTEDRRLRQQGITYHNTTIKYASNNSRSSAGGPGKRHSSGVESRIAVVV